MTFQDIFKSSFLENINTITPFDMLLTFSMAFALGMLIFFIYKRTYSGVMYSASFGICLIGLTLVTTLLILAVSSNVVLSLGMVGALSIVRFRTAIKDPVDILFLFWSISAGIVLAAGLIPLAVFGSAFIAAVLLVFSEKKTYDKPYILVLHCKDVESEDAALNYIKSQTQKLSIKSKTVSPATIELNFEVRLKDDNTSFINALAGMSGITNVIMVSYNGDYMG